MNKDKMEKDEIEIIQAKIEKDDNDFMNDDLFVSNALKLLLHKDSINLQ